MTKIYWCDDCVLAFLAEQYPELRVGDKCPNCEESIVKPMIMISLKSYNWANERLKEAGMPEWV